MLQTFKNGQGSIVLRAKLLDSSSTTGAGLAGLTSASTGLIISTIADNEAAATAYTVAGSTVETITTLGTYAAPTATKCRFKEVDATNHKGIYEFQFADARFAVSSAKSLLISVAGVTNLQQADFLVQLQTDDPFVAKPTNYASLSIDGSGRVDIAKIAGTVQTARDLGASVLLSSGTGTGQLDFTSGVVKANLAQILGTALTETAGQIAAAFKQFFNIATPAATMDHLVLVDTVTTATTATNLTNAPTNGDLTATMKTSVTTAATAATPVAASVTGNVGGNVVGSVSSVTAGVTVTTNNDKTGYGLSATAVQAIWDAATSALTTVGSIGKWILDKLDVVVSTRLASASYTAPPSSATIAGDVWDVTLASHLTAGTTGNALNAAGSAGDPWTTAIPGAYSAGTAGHRLGNIPDVAAGASGGVFIAGSNAATAVSITGNLTGNVSGSVGSVTGAVGSVTGAVGSVTGNVGGSVASVTAGVTVTTNNDKTGYGLSAAAIQAVWDALTSALTTVGSIGKKLADWTIGTAQTGDSFARLGAPAGASVSADIAAAKVDTAAIKAKTDNLPASPAAVGSAMALTSGERTTLSGVVLTTQVTEAYRANGAAPTPAQFICEVLGHLGESSISGTTKTVKKLDHTTSAETFTLDDATTPSSITRAT